MIIKKITSFKAEPLFNKLLQDWQKERNANKVIMATSGVDSQTYTESYNKIINEMSGEALPFIIAELEKGNHYLNRAAKEIMKVSDEQLVSKDKIVSAQQITKKLIEWYANVYSKKTKKETKSVQVKNKTLSEPSEVQLEELQSHLRKVSEILKSLSDNSKIYKEDYQKFSSFINKTSFKQSISI